MKRQWMDTEIEFMKNNFQQMSCAEMAVQLKRTTRSVRHKYLELRLVRRKAQVGDVINGWKIQSIFEKNTGVQNVNYAHVISTLDNKTTGIYRLTQLTNGKVGWPDRRRPDVVEKNTKHNLSKHKLYGVWYGMKDRCNNHQNVSFMNYGGRGIQICEEWTNFLSFYNWSIENGYKSGLTIDRINVNGNYCPQNCRWITPQEQAWNRTTNIHIDVTAFGETKTLRSWMIDDRCKIKHLGVLLYRLGAGWEPEKAMTKKSQRKSKKYIYSLEFYRFVQSKYPDVVKEFLESIHV